LAGKTEKTMIHEFVVLLKNEISEEERDGAGAIEMNEVRACWEAVTDEGCTIVSFKDGDAFTIRCQISDFISIWKTCTEDIKI
jgi:hypothetical protein